MVTRTPRWSSGGFQVAINCPLETALPPLILARPLDRYSPRPTQATARTHASTPPKEVQAMPITFSALAEVSNSTTQEQQMKYIASLSIAEQIEICRIQKEIYSKIFCESREEKEKLSLLKKDSSGKFNYYTLLLASQIYKTQSALSRNKSFIRESNLKTAIARKKRKVSSLKDCIKHIIFPIDEMKAEGLSWQQIASILNKHFQKELVNRKISGSYLKECYHDIKKRQE